MDRVGIILLAAGASRRLGSPKQLVDVGGVPLIRVVATRLLTLHPHAMCVVLGAAAATIESALADLPVEIVVNQAWSEGIGASIACGIRHLEGADVDCALIALCDQPAIPASHFRALCERFASDRCDIVATGYEGQSGVPALFGRAVFSSLASLRGDRGAKSIIVDPCWRGAAIHCAEAGIDLDTAEDLERFRGNGA